MKTIKLDIVSPERLLFSGEVEQVKLPGTLGAFTILPGHAPIVSSLRQGNVTYVPVGGTAQSLQMKSGFVEMSHGKATVCVE